MEVYDFGLRLKELRNRKKLSQTDVGLRVGVSRSAINGYEANTQKPSIDTLKKLALLYNSSADYILGITNESYYVDDGLHPEEQEAIFEVVDLLTDKFKKIRQVDS